MSSREKDRAHSRVAMGNSLIQFIPKEGAQILLVLFLSFLIGLEREEQKVASDQYRFGGVRTFPLLGLLGYALSVFSQQNLLLPSFGFAIVGAFLWQSYRHKLEGVAVAGMTTELSGLMTYVIGALVWRELYWIATTLTVLAVVLLELKTALESLAKQVPGDEILTFAKFLLLTAVILPIVPNQTFGSFGFNPFKTWLVVVAVSAISYGSYLLQVWTKSRGDVMLAAVLGGAYSSTLTTVVLAKRARGQSRPHLYSGSILVASGVMYLRLLGLLGIFNRPLLHRLGLPFLFLAAVALFGGWLWMHLLDHGSAKTEQSFQPKNPLELGAALLFAGLFVGMLFITHLSLLYLGRRGLFTVAGVMGVTDVDPFILSLAASTSITPIPLAGGAIIIAAASNNLIKGIYAYGFGDRQTGTLALALLAGLALLGLLPLFL
ncbi:MAG TPA: MgtC/SapB family protein [Candidatus Acidoferrales bacterium]|nr:MgtC/SapB family protein [Candidatus Acidoferrales bacterium]